MLARSIPHMGASPASSLQPRVQASLACHAVCRLCLDLSISTAALVAKLMSSKHFSSHHTAHRAWQYRTDRRWLAVAP